MKKIIPASILTVFILLAISFVSSAELNTSAEERESPLYKIRTGRAITEKISNIVENIKTRFIGERIFFIPIMDGFYRTGTRLWTSMCTEVPTLPGCGEPCITRINSPICLSILIKCN